MSQQIPTEFRTVADDLTRLLVDALGANFVGLYAYGSLFDESFVPSNSDLDCIAVTAAPLDDASLARLAPLLVVVPSSIPGLSRVQMSILVRDQVLEDDPSACLFQFGDLRRSGSDGNPIIWLDFFQRGAILHGPDPSSFVPDITREMLHAALVREVGYLKDEISLNPDSEWRDKPSYRAYAVLTLCRILYTHTSGSIVSKSQAAAWVSGNHPDWIAQLASIAEGTRREAWIVEIPIHALEQLIAYTSAYLNPA